MTLYCPSIKNSFLLRDLIIYKNCLQGVFVCGCKPHIYSIAFRMFLSFQIIRAINLYIMIISKLFVRFQFEDRAYDRWDWRGRGGEGERGGRRYIVIHGQFNAQPRVGNVSRSLGRNTIIASNDSIETLIDGIAWEQHLRFLKFAASRS